jgi:hypothetical protein
MYARFMTGLPAYLRRAVTLEEAQAAIRQGLAERDENFLRIFRNSIVGHPGSPYRVLMDWAGIAPGDVERWVKDAGLEPALERLRAAGVCVNFEEYKGRSPIVRGDNVLRVDEHAFDNPMVSSVYEGRTGGSTGVGTRVETDLDNLMSTAPHLMLGRHVHGLIGVPMAVWYGTLPDATGLDVYLRAVAYRGHPEKWFVPVTEEQPRPALRFRLATAYVLAISRLCGVPCPRPEPLPVADAIEVARWAEANLPRCGKVEIVTNVSLAIRVASAAVDAGIDLTGTSFFGGGEPFTRAKSRAVARSGARFVSIYISADAGPMGLPCARPLEENDQHLLEDNLAVIQHQRQIDDQEIDAFYFTSLRPLASKVLLNMESDDYGIIEERDCGCPLEELGYRHHVRRIQSFGKLTGEGVTLVGSDMLRILEEDLPQRFGGTPQDFQLVEEEIAETGLTRLALRVHPRLDIGSEDEVIDATLEAIGKGGDAGSLASSLWKQAGTLVVRREPPRWTPRGKLLPIQRLGATSAVAPDAAPGAPDNAS